MSLLKYWLALWWRKRLVKELNERKREMDKPFIKKWAHIQGQILTKGGIKWQWHIMMK